MPGSNRHLLRVVIQRLLGSDLGAEADMGANLVRAVEEAVADGGSGPPQVAAAQCLCLVFAALLLHRLHALRKWTAATVTRSLAVASCTDCGQAWAQAGAVPDGPSTVGNSSGDSCIMIAGRLGLLCTLGWHKSYRSKHTIRH